MNKFIALCLAATGLAGLPLTQANAHEAAPVSVGVATLPATARVNATVVVETHRMHHRRFRTVRTVRYRHGRKIVTVRRVYY